MTSIGFGLNIPSKSGSKKSGIPAGPPTRKPIARKPPPGFFGAGDDDDDASGTKANESDDEPSTGVFSKNTKSKRRDPAKPPSKPPTSATHTRSSVNSDLAAHIAQSTSQALSAEAEAASVDPTIYAYDSVFDSMKSATSSARNDKSSISLDDPSSRKPKYMASLLAAAETRKRDQLRAKERMLQREREAEGEEFADKEKFVTGAYKAQQEEMQRLEEEEAKREEEERKKSRGLTGLYRNLLDRTEEKHVAAVVASKNVDVNEKIQDGDDDDIKKKKEEEEKKKEAKKQLPSHVEVNDEGAVVDKRQLLSGGLNILASGSSSKKPAASGQNTSTSSTASMGYQGRNRAEIERRARQTRMLEEQLEATQKRAREEEDSKAKEFAERQVKRGKSEGEVMGAKERYLARKKAKEEEERKAKAGGGV